ncbi:unnamed protein product [Trichogramma brassicae]|uniref:Uncharacterized protein n=1 Tax=Trichogramma brassicae TaxID=86971 RepID=A0A6H5HWY7_9HYME|nr:unnamed protein product [Trichogramma brassicae]
MKRGTTIQIVHTFHLPTLLFSPARIRSVLYLLYVTNSPLQRVAETSGDAGGVSTSSGGRGTTGGPRREMANVRAVSLCRIICESAGSCWLDLETAIAEPPVSVSLFAPSVSSSIEAVLRMIKNIDADCEHFTVTTSGELIELIVPKIAMEWGGKIQYNFLSLRCMCSLKELTRLREQASVECSTLNNMKFLKMFKFLTFNTNAYEYYQTISRRDQGGVTERPRAYSYRQTVYARTLAIQYKAILLPRLTYASVVWWPRVKLTGTRGRLENMLRGATGAMRTTPTKALGIIMDVPPIHVEVRAVAVNAAHRLRSLGLWKHGTRHTRLELLDDPVLCMRGDWMSASIAEKPAWETIFPSREDWLSKQDSLPGSGECWYTDGSKTRGLSGAGYYRSQYPKTQSNESCTIFTMLQDIQEKTKLIVPYESGSIGQTSEKTCKITLNDAVFAPAEKSQKLQLRTFDRTSPKSLRIPSLWTSWARIPSPHEVKDSS